MGPQRIPNSPERLRHRPLPQTKRCNPSRRNPRSHAPHLPQEYPPRTPHPIHPIRPTASSQRIAITAFLGPRIRPHLAQPTRKSNQLPTLSYEEPPEIPRLNLLCMEPRIGLQPPLQILAPPWTKPMPSRRIPQKSRHLTHRQPRQQEYRARPSPPGSASKQQPMRVTEALW
jgi:hypothetical protein